MSQSQQHRGFTLVEVLLSLFVVGVGLMATAPLYLHATKKAEASGDLAEVGALAVKQMELLRAVAYTSLPAGGSLTGNVTGFFDASDLKATVRWTVVNESTRLKLITVRAIATRSIDGPAKRVDLAVRRTR